LNHQGATEGERNNIKEAKRDTDSDAGKRFVAGVVLCDGEACASFGDGMYAVPLPTLWETT